jgi:hypothetical protein
VVEKINPVALVTCVILNRDRIKSKISDKKLKYIVNIFNLNYIVTTNNCFRFMQILWKLTFECLLIELGDVRKKLFSIDDQQLFKK